MAGQISAKGERVKKLVTQKGYSLARAAREVGMSANSLRRSAWYREHQNKHPAGRPATNGDKKDAK